MSEPLKVVFSRCPVGTATEYSMRKGWLQEVIEKNGAEFCLLQSMDENCRSAHFTQLPPLHFRDGGNIPPTWAQSLGDRSVLLGVSFQKEYRGLFVRKDSPLKSIEDLAKAKLAVAVRPDAVIDFRYVTAMRGYDCILSHLGFAPEKMEYVPIDCRDIRSKRAQGLNTHGKDSDDITEDVQAVLDGRADVFFEHSIKAVRMERNGLFRNLLTPEMHREIPNINNNAVLAITCTKPFAYEHPEIVVAYLGEIIRAARIAAKNHEDFLVSSASGVYGATAEEMAASFENETLFSRVPEISTRGLEMMNSQKEFIIKCGVIDRANDFDIEKWVDGSFLKAALEAADREI